MCSSDLAVLYGNKRLYDAVKEKEKLYMSKEFTNAVNDRLAQLEMISAEEDPSYEYEVRIEKILSSLGFSDFEKPMSEVENSDKFKVLLAQVLFPKPDILFLDEPTNNTRCSTSGIMTLRPTWADIAHKRARIAEGIPGRERNVPRGKRRGSAHAVSAAPRADTPS